MAGSWAPDVAQQQSPHGGAAWTLTFWKWGMCQRASIFTGGLYFRR